MGIFGTGGGSHSFSRYDMDFIVKNEIIPGPYPQDGYDHYVFKGVNVVVTHD